MEDLDLAVEVSNDLPTSFSLYQNYPNPFNPTTTIRFDVPVASSIRLSVYDMLGRRIETLQDQFVPAGQHSALFNPENLSTGVLLYRLETEAGTITRTMMLLK